MLNMARLINNLPCKNLPPELLTYMNSAPSLFQCCTSTPQRAVWSCWHCGEFGKFHGAQTAQSSRRDSAMSFRKRLPNRSDSSPALKGQINISKSLAPGPQTAYQRGSLSIVFATCRPYWVLAKKSRPLKSRARTMAAWSCSLQVLRVITFSIK